MNLYVIFIKNYRNKALWAGISLSLCLIVFLVVSLFMRHNLACNITINDAVSFSCPLSFEVGNVYINEQNEENSVQTSIAFRKPLLQKFNSFSSLKGKFSFSYPSLFSTSEKTFAGSDILYHVELENKAAGSHGFVQVWNLPHPLEDFLQASFQTSQQVYKNFKKSTITVTGLPGYFWDYVVLGSDGTYYKASEVFFQNGAQMYRLSYFCPEQSWDAVQEQIFWDMATSLRIHE
jgi:hypothetical protein